MKMENAFEIELGKYDCCDKSDDHRQKRRTKKPLLVFGIFAVLFITMLAFHQGTACAQKADKKEVVVPFFQWPIGGGWEGYIIFDRLVADDHPWLRPKSQETPGFVYNVKAVERTQSFQKTTAFGFSVAAEWLAQRGVKPFFEKPITVDWKWLYGEGLHGNAWLVTTDPNIKSAADLKGKHIAVGTKNQTHWGAFVSVFLEQGFGITEKNTPIAWLGQEKAMDALIDGNADAAVVGFATDAKYKVALPTPGLTRLAASGKKFYYVDLPREVVEKVNRNLNAPFIPITIPPNTLPKQPQPVQWFADIFVRMVHPDFPDDLAYEITKEFIKLGPKSGSFTGVGKTWTKETMVRPFLEQPDKIHPGALRAFKEAGLWPPEKVLK